jgi:hypothetical protein
MLSACHILIVTIVKRLFHIWTQHLSLLGKASIHSVVSNVCFWCELSYVAADGCCSSADQWRTSNELNSPINVKKLFSLNIFSMGQITHRKPQKSFLLSCRTCQRCSGIVICISASPYNQRGIVRSLLTKPENFGNQNFIAC